MALIRYDDADAAAFVVNRHLAAGALDAWRAAIVRYVEPRAGLRLLDLGAGTGSWARAFAAWWPEAEIVAVEPSAAMRERAVFAPVRPGHATEIPVDDASLDAVWLSTVVHHVADLAAAARELRRVLRPGGVVLIRSAFAGRHEGISLFRYFPEAAAVLDARYPSVARVEAAFGAAGFTTTGFEPVSQVTASTLREAAESLRREAHTPLQLITNEAYAAGVERLRAAAAERGTGTGPVIDALDLLVLTAATPGR